MHYSIKENKLICDYCDSKYEISHFTVNTAGAGEDEYEVNSFICPSCRGSIVSVSEEALAYCPYCNSQVELKKKTITAHKPEYIIPFKVTRENSKKIFDDKAQAMPFLPDEFKSSKNFDSLVGIYLPFWLYEGTVSGDFVTRGKKEEHKNKIIPYIKTTYFDSAIAYSGNLNMLPKDASEAFDDNITEKILPYDFKSALSFHPAYMAGYYADIPTVSPEEYKSSVANDVLQEYFNSDRYIRSGAFKLKNIVGHLNNDEKKIDVKAHEALYPVWFMTYRKKNRVAYSVINGESGEISTDAPVDVKKLIKSIFMWFVPLFLLFMILPSIPAGYLTSVNMLVSVFSLVMSALVFKMSQRRALTKHKTYKVGKRGKPGRSIFDSPCVVLSLAMLIITALFGLSLSPDDIYRYILTIATMGVLIINLILLFGILKRLSDRALPYFERKDLHYGE